MFAPDASPGGRFDGLPHEAVAEHVGALVAEREQLDRAMLLAVDAWLVAGGADVRCVGEVRAVADLLRVPVRHARDLCAVLRVCRQHDATRGAVCSGAVRVAALAEFAPVVTPRRSELYGEHERTILEALSGLRVDEVRTYARHWGALADDLLDDPDVAGDHERRGLWASHGSTHGHLHAAMAPDACAELLATLDALVPPDPHDIPGGPRTTAQRRHDALADLVRLAGDGAEPSEGGGTSVTINAVVDLATLDPADDEDTDHADGRVGRSEIDHAGPVPPHALRRLACDGWLTRTVMGARGEVLDHSRRVRLFTPAQRRAIRVLHPRCAWRLCPHPANWCDVHHLHDVEHGGPTDLANGVPLCRHHHTRVHLGWTLHRGADGSYEPEPPGVRQRRR